MDSFYGELSLIDLSLYKKKTTIRLTTNRNYYVHTTPLFIELGLLKVQDRFKLKLLKFYCELSYD